MKQTFLKCLLAALLMLAYPTTAPAKGPERACGDRSSVDTLKEMWAALFACYKGSPGNEDSEITLVFSLRRDGTLIGRPKITAKKLIGDDVQKRQFLVDVIEGIDQSLPLPFSQSMGSIVAGRVLAVRFKGDGYWSVRY